MIIKDMQPIFNFVENTTIGPHKKNNFKMKLDFFNREKQKQKFISTLQEIVFLIDREKGHE